MSSPTWLASVTALACAQHFVITRRQALRCGASRQQWQGKLGGLLTPLFPGVGMVAVEGAPAIPGPQQRGRAALFAVDPAAGWLCLGSVLRLHGVAGTPLNDPEHVLVDKAGAHTRRGVVRHHFAVPRHECGQQWSLPVTRFERALHDAVGTYDRAHAVAVLDSARSSGLMGQPALDALAARARRSRQGWFDLVDPHSESPLETRTRLLFIAHGIPWRSQVTIDLPSYGRARVDFLVGDRLVVECDGTEVHDTPLARYKDRTREDALRAQGFQVIRLTWGDVVHRPVETLARIRSAAARW